MDYYRGKTTESFIAALHEQPRPVIVSKNVHLALKAANLGEPVRYPVRNPERAGRRFVYLLRERVARLLLEIAERQEIEHRDKLREAVYATFPTLKENG